MKLWKMIRSFGGALGCVALAACSIDSAPDRLGATPAGDGSRVRFDLYAEPLPDIPLPNDVASWPDPTSRTGVRINAALAAPTSMERIAREKLSRMEGWGTFQPITIAFDPAGDLAGRAAIDLSAVSRRHQHDDYDFADDAVYLVDLETGVPVPLDLGEGAFNPILKNLGRYWRNDARANEENILFETYDEAAGKVDATYSPALDTDFDGVLDRPNLADGSTCAAWQDVASDPAKQLERDKCIADHLLTWYERESNTLIARPVVPLEQKHVYAVVVTDRLVDPKGRPVRSPLETIYHPTQEKGIARLSELLSGGAHSQYFGDIGGTGLAHVAFAWTFTTEPTVEDMVELRDGLYGKGPFAALGDRFPAKLDMQPAVGPLLQSDLDGFTAAGTPPPTYDEWAQTVATCKKKVPQLYILKVDEIHDLLGQIVSQVFGLSGPEGQALTDSWTENLDYLAVGTYQSPFLVEGGPKGKDPNASFNLDFSTGEGYVGSDTVQFWLTVPKATSQHHQPFPVNIYGHGYTGNSTELFLYAGTMARMGMATIGINAVGHGLSGIDAGTASLARGLFKANCLAPAAEAFFLGRARDLNDDGDPDSGGDFWTSYLFHTRDVVRQSVLDHVQLTRILRSFDGKTLSDQDFNHDGKADKAGDFDGDGTPDVAGPGTPIGTWGQSLGAFLSAVHGALDPGIDSAAPTSGGTMIDVGTRSFQGGVVEAVILRNLGPLVVGTPASQFYGADGTPVYPGRTSDPSNSTACAASQVSMRYIVPDLNGTREIEFACAGTDKFPATGATVVVFNQANGETRCARASADGSFRLGVPSTRGDAMEVHVFSQADAVKSYGSCELVSPRVADLVVTKWGKGYVAKGAIDPHHQGATLCANAPSCIEFQGGFIEEGAPLASPADGYGFTRQSPDLRRFLSIAQAILDPADAISYMPYYGLKHLPDIDGKPMASHGLLDIQTIGDMNVPISAGIEYARAAGALPIFRADQAAKYPEWADYAAPAAVVADCDQRTPNRLLIDEHVVEGISRLQRHPVAPANCKRNLKVTPASMACFDRRGCTATPAVCNANETCVSDACVPNADADTCARTLFDPDALAEGKQLFGAASPTVPLRLARYAQNATSATLDGVWAPRLLGRPGGDDGKWTPSGAPLVAVLDAMVEATGTHTFTNPLPCKNFDESLYLSLVVAQFFNTKGGDLYYLSHPKTHHCFESLTCPELAR